MPEIPRPLIPIVGELLPDNPPRTRLSERYAQPVERAGGRPVVLPYRPGTGFVDDALALADGLLFSGGDDFATEELGLGPTHPQASPVPAAKQRLDLELARAVLERGIPVLGVCYGMQLLALESGGQLHYDIPTDHQRPGEHRLAETDGRHPLDWNLNSQLAGLLGESAGPVNSLHHQAVADPGRGGVVCASADDGIIEAIEFPDRGFCVGVQWHPEKLSGAHRDQLFQAFVHASRSGRKRSDAEY